MRIGTLLLLFFVLAAGGCRKRDVRTTVIDVPGMADAAAAQRIQDALLSKQGIQSAIPDLERHRLTVTYDSMVTARKNVEFTIAEAGFDANDIPAQAVRPAAPPSPVPQPPAPQPAADGDG